jgi:peptide/nickel transport system ATP-binding protein
MLGLIYQISKIRFGMSLLETIVTLLFLTIITIYIIGLMDEESQIPPKKMYLMILRGIIPTFTIGWVLRLIYDLLIYDDILLGNLAYNPFSNILFVSIMVSIYFPLFLIWVKKYEGFYNQDDDDKSNQINHFEKYKKAFSKLILFFWSITALSFIICVMYLPTKTLYYGLFFAFLTVLLLNGVIMIFNMALPIEKKSRDTSLSKEQGNLLLVFLSIWTVSLLVSLSVLLYGIIDQIWFIWLFNLIGLFFVPGSLKKLGLIPVKIPDKSLKNARAFSSAVAYSAWIIQLLFLEVFWVILEKNGVFDIHQDIRLNIILCSAIFFVAIFVSLKKKFIPHAITKNVSRLRKSLLKKKVVIESSNVILDVSDLVTYFYTEEGIVRAVEGVSFQIFEGEVLGLVGETGCGKSVSALSILQLVQHPGKIESGSIIYRGENLLEKTKEEMLAYRGSKITMCFQDPLNSINPVFKVGDQIAEVFLLHQRPQLFKIVEENIQKIDDCDKKIKEIEKDIKILLNKEIAPTSDTKSKEITLMDDLSAKRDDLNREKNTFKKYITIHSVARRWCIDLIRDVGIPDPEQKFDSYPHELSGGMRQRISIAIAIACKPDLLIADEPTTALDVTIQNQILKLFKDLRKKYQTSILFITHDLGIISKMCDRVAVMYSGYIVEYGSSITLFKTPYHPYTKALLASIPHVRKKGRDLEIIPGMVPNLIFPPSGCRFHPRCGFCFEPCASINPKSIEIEPNYFVACHLYDTKYKNEANAAIEKNEKENRI